MIVLKSKIVDKHKGYVIKKELWKYAADCPPQKMIQAYTYKGDYIGDSKTAKYICKKLEIKPIKSDENHVCCSIGYSRKDKKWYGWSHRAICGFNIGFTIKLEDDLVITDKTPIGFEAKTLDDCKMLAKIFAENVS